MSIPIKSANAASRVTAVRLASVVFALGAASVFDCSEAWTSQQNERSSPATSAEPQPIKTQDTVIPVADDKTRLETILESDVPLERFAGELGRVEGDLARLAAGLVPPKHPEPFKDVDDVMRLLHELHLLSQPLPDSVVDSDVAETTAADEDEAEEVSTDLPYEHAAAAASHFEQARQHAANATACAQRALACQRRAHRAFRQSNAEMVRKNVEQIVYFAWCGRQESQRSRDSRAVGLGAWLADTEGFETYQKSSDQTAEECFAKRQAELRRTGLPAPYATMLRDSGFTDEQLDRHCNELLALDPKRAAEAYGRLRSAAQPGTEKATSSDSAQQPTVAEDVVWARVGLLWATARQKLEATQ